MAAIFKPFLQKLSPFPGKVNSEPELKTKVFT